MMVKYSQTKKKKKKEEKKKKKKESCVNKTQAEGKMVFAFEVNLEIFCQHHNGLVDIRRKYAETTQTQTTLPGLLKLHNLLQLLHDGFLHYHFIQTHVGDHATVKIFHPQSSSELQVGPLQEVLLAHLWVLSITGHSNGESRQYSILYEASGQFKTKSQLSLQ